MFSQCFIRSTAIRRNSFGYRPFRPLAICSSFPCKVCLIRVSQVKGSVHEWGGPNVPQLDAAAVHQFVSGPPRSCVWARSTENFLVFLLFLAYRAGIVLQHSPKIPVSKGGNSARTGVSQRQQLPELGG